VAPLELAMQARLLAALLGFVVLFPIAEQSWLRVMTSDVVTRLVAD
jgi:hypothetical protein